MAETISSSQSSAPQRGAERREGANVALARRDQPRLRGVARVLRFRASETRTPLGAPPWRFQSPRPRFLNPAVFVRRTNAASSSQPGHSARRADPRGLPSLRLRAAAAGRHSLLRFKDRLEKRPSTSRDDSEYSRRHNYSQHVLYTRPVYGGSPLPGASRA